MVVLDTSVEVSNLIRFINIRGIVMSADSLNKYWKLKKKLSRISLLINLELQERCYYETHSDLSLRIVKSLSTRSKLSGFLLLVTLVRFGDLFNIDLPDSVNSGYVKIIQNKTGKSLVSDFNIQSDLLRYELVTLDQFYQTINYQTLSNEIKRFTMKIPFFNNVDWNHSCHIFRHLESSYLFSKDIPISFIAKKLGDEEKTVKVSYIHKELLRLFS